MHMTTSKVLFSIDGVNNIHANAKFMRYLDTQRAMHKTKGIAAICIGSWQGEMEQSFLMDERDFNAFIRNTDWIAKQVCVLHVSGDTRQPCTMEYLQTGECTVEGPIRKVSRQEANELDGWTYVLETNSYFTTGGAS